MGVVMKGGNSGCREDYLAPVPDSGSPQPVLDTSTSGPVPSTVVMCPGGSGSDEDFCAQMPTGGTIPQGSTDIEDPKA